MNHVLNIESAIFALQFFIVYHISSVYLLVFLILEIHNRITCN